MYKSYHRLCNS